MRWGSVWSWVQEVGRGQIPFFIRTFLKVHCLPRRLGLGRPRRCTWCFLLDKRWRLCHNRISPPADSQPWPAGPENQNKKGLQEFTHCAKEWLRGGRKKSGLASEPLALDPDELEQKGKVLQNPHNICLNLVYSSSLWVKNWRRYNTKCKKW